MSAFTFRAAVVLALLLVRPAAAFTILEPSVDYRNYSHALSPGGSTTGSVWGAVGDADLDDRASQFLVRFNTSSVATPGQGAANYQITTLTLSLTVSNSNAFRYDSTTDSFRTYLDPSAPNYQADTDLGRPIELFAVNYRNGYSEATFGENSPYSNGGTRNAFAAGFNGSGNLVDVSNNVANGVEVTPLAVGHIEGVAEGGLVPLESVMTFTLNLTDPAAIAWMQASLNAGYLEFMITALTPTEQMASTGFAAFYTKENLNHDPSFGDYLAGQLSGDVAIVPVPEPATVLLLAAGGAMLAWRRRWK